MEDLLRGNRAYETELAVLGMERRAGSKFFLDTADGHGIKGIPSHHYNSRQNRFCTKIRNGLSDEALVDAKKSRKITQISLILGI